MQELKENRPKITTYDIAKIIERYDSISIQQLQSITQNSQEEIMRLVSPLKELKLIIEYKKKMSIRNISRYKTFFKKRYDLILNKYEKKEKSYTF